MKTRSKTPLHPAEYPKEVGREALQADDQLPPVPLSIHHQQAHF